MSENTDRIGVVRQHRWIGADKQAELLRLTCPKVVSLGGGKVRQVERDDLEKLARPGTQIVFVHAFLLADPARKRTRGGMQADFRAALARIEKRGAVVVDTDGQICSGKHRKAMLALVDRDIGRSNQGAKSAAIAAARRGRSEADFTKHQIETAHAVWHNRKTYPRWVDVDGALAKIVSPNGHKFTRFRAHRMWGGRI